ncbi:MAG: glutamine amidotransferase [Desulfotignum sp.]|nr:glutamine amidotransferase [Desulfotignum sp.]MCF8086757.1 glutamine amidotransferase [Desulfotignum sp.]MCF8136477.1 glutamine amidotransferase [Desulfotignum sp.]
MTKPTILIVKTGDTFDDLIRSFGDFDDWIREGLGVGEDQVRSVNAPAFEVLPDPGTFSGVVIAGSHAMVTQNLDWSLKVEEWLAPVVTAGIPVLGICYGHQLLAKAMGGKVDFHPKGLEIGTASITLTADALSDPLFQGLPPIFNAHTCHSQTVLTLPPGAVHLAKNAHDPHHAFRLGRAAWGVQFHPEYTHAIMAGYIRNMSPLLQALGRDPAQIQQKVTDSPEAAQMLTRFAALCCHNQIEH